MRLTYRMAVNLFESVEGSGIGRDELVTPLGLGASDLVDPARGLDWETLVALLARLSAVVGGDVERLREVGRNMPSTPSYGFLQTVANAAVTLEDVYLAGERWVATASVPHLVMATEFPSEGQLRFRCGIPEPYAASAPYLHVFEGLLCAIPRLLGLPDASILESLVTPRQLDVLLALPEGRPVVECDEVAAVRLVDPAGMIQLLEEQRVQITDALEAIRRSSAEMISLLELLPDLVVVHRAGAIVWLNRAAAAALGRTGAAELVGTRFVDLFHESSRALANERIEELVADDAAGAVDARLVARDGTLVLVEVSPPQAASFGGRPASLFVARDVTERKRLQQQLAVTDRLASVGMLAAGVAHEVNNPLAYVLNNIEVARREVSALGPKAETSRASLDVALEGVDRIRSIIRDLLALSRVDDSAIRVVDVRAVVESTLALAVPQITERAELVTELDAAPLAVGTAARIGQVLLNLVANALEAMPVARRSTNVLRVVVREAPGAVLIEVSDNGVGIAPEHASRIFEPFFTTKPLGMGTGLGLPISHRLIAEVGGELSFESVPTGGTSFRVTLARADADQRESDEPATAG